MLCAGLSAATRRHGRRADYLRSYFSANTLRSFLSLLVAGHLEEASARLSRGSAPALTFNNELLNGITRMPANRQ